VQEWTAREGFVGGWKLRRVGESSIPASIGGGRNGAWAEEDKFYFGMLLFLSPS
jgi:hypothetical protein